MRFNFFKSKKFYLIVIIALLTIGVFLNFLFRKTSRSSRASSVNVYARFVPTKVEVNKDDTFAVDVFLNSGDKRVSGVRIAFFYSSNIQFLNSDNLVEDLSNNCKNNQGEKFNGLNNIIPYVSTQTVDGIRGNVVGVVRTSFLKDNELPSGSFCFTTLRFKAIKEGNASIHFFALENENHTEIVGPDSNSYVIRPANNANVVEVNIKIPGSTDLTPTPTPKPHQTPTPTPISQTSGNVKFVIALRFQGVKSLPKSDVRKIPVKVSLRKWGGDLVEDPKIVDFTVNEQGIWEGEVDFSIPSDGKYLLYIKGPKHMQKKICSLSPSETYPGTYSCSASEALSLQKGKEYSIDLTNIVILVGDLPEQDGIINSYDISLVRNLLGRQDEEALSSADVNFDGIVNTQDFALIQAALSVRYDEL